jgi:mRNA-degrading endonuclease RelE of RelBE toxin-antitoxin system
MKTKIRTSVNFRKKAKHLLKKYDSLKSELLHFQEILLENPDFGTPLGNNCYKIRLAVKSKGKGKSGGLRVITYVVANFVETENEKIINLVTIYDKSEFTTISNKELGKLIEEIKKEILF